MVSTGNSIELPSENHRWVLSKYVPSKGEHRGLGSEVIAGMQKEQRQRAIRSLTELNPTHCRSPFCLHGNTITSRESALVNTHFDHLECATTVRCDDQGTPLIQHLSPESKEDALAWAHEAIHIKLTSQNAFQFREETPISTMWRRTQRSFGWEEQLMTALVSAVSLDLLRTLSRTISAAKQLAYPGGYDIQNLNVPLLNALDVDLSAAGTEYRLLVARTLTIYSGTI
ncbi:hypothetical protein ETB97_010286 [Aspergillus alliaceus]|uniref:Uncharacterized protein n=1 Tax=Petromyces alliaceus TaxID=209559 RepID=A0A8H5ZQI1_PETAA|nr:hypothetical protein ETB97_010286 [Aspergillus burnettii]